jgi:RNA polymerase sigma-70 factor (ECF subfamily)
VPTTDWDPSWDWATIRSLCLREAQRVLGSSTDAEDAAQEAAVRAWRRRGSCLDPSRPNPWVAAIARREALRIAGRRRETALEDVPELGQDAAGSDTIPHGDALQAIFGGLTADDRLLLFGRYVQDLTHRELAQRSGLKEGTVRVRLHRLRSVLKDRLVET